MSKRLPEDVIHIFVSLCWRLFECWWEYLKMSFTSSFLFVEGYSNVDDITWRWHKDVCFSLLKVIRMLMRIPEDVINIFVSLCRTLFESRREYLKMWYTSSFLLSKVIRMLMGIPEDVIHILVLLGEGYSNVDGNTSRCHIHLRFSCRRLFKYRWDYLKMSYTSSFLLSMVIWMSMRIPEDVIHLFISLVEGYSNVDGIPEDDIQIFVSFVKGYSNVDENTGRCHTHLGFSLSKVIPMLMRIPEDVIQILVSLCRRLFECRWEYLKMSYTSSFLFVESYLNVDENGYSKLLSSIALKTLMLKLLSWSENPNIIWKNVINTSFTQLWNTAR